MRVTVSSPGRFHTFDLAEQLHSRGHLRKMFTGYPSWKVPIQDKNLISSFPWTLGLLMIMGRLGLSSLQRSLEPAVTVHYDNLVAHNLVDCEVFHCSSSFGLSSFAVAKREYGAKTVCDRGSTHIRFQDRILAEEFARWGKEYKPIDQRILERELCEYEQCDRIFVPSTFVLNSFLEEGVAPQKIRKIPYGVDLNLFKRRPKEDNVFRVIYVGTIGLRKGIPYLLKAVGGLNIPNMETWLIGNVLPEAEDFLNAYHDAFHYKGRIPRENLKDYYSQGSVFVIASIEEGLALVQAQAMACGLPVISTENTGGADLFTDGTEGFIVPIQDSRAIREKIEYLYLNPEIRNRMGEAAVERVRSIGGWDRYGARVISEYGKLL